MLKTQLENMTVLITGGTRGLGKAIARLFAEAGARTFVTYRWGSIDPDELSAEFQALGLPAPEILECDASDPEANRELLKTIEEQAGRLDVIVSNVAFSKTVGKLGDLKKNAMDLSLGYSAWPLVDLVQATQEATGQFPRYVVAISSDGMEVCHTGYDLAGVSKAVLETLCRYLALRLKEHGVRVNAIRPGFLDTASFRATFGDAAAEAAEERVKGIFLDPAGVASTCVALCSGLMDSVTGQVIVVDEGWSLVSPLAYITGENLPAPFPEKARRANVTEIGSGDGAGGATAHEAFPGNGRETV